MMKNGSIQINSGSSQIRAEYELLWRWENPVRVVCFITSRRRCVRRRCATVSCRITPVSWLSVNFPYLFFFLQNWVFFCQLSQIQKNSSKYWSVCAGSLKLRSADVLDYQWWWGRASKEGSKLRLLITCRTGRRIWLVEAVLSSW